MGAKKHHGVCVIITDERREFFYVQRKDEAYRPVEYRGAHSFFGGAMERGEDASQALRRELNEELMEPIAKMIFADASKYATLEAGRKGRTYDLEVFEAIMPLRSLEMMASQPVREGSGLLMRRADLLKSKFVYGLDAVLSGYISKH
jgi:hypothetical protein